MNSHRHSINVGDGHNGPWTIRGARLLSADAEPHRVDIVVDGSRIASVCEVGSADTNVVVDADGLDVMPGAIDLHIHFRDPGQTHKETVETGTAAAAAGGVTLVCDMPSTQPQVTTEERFGDKLLAWEGRASVDYAFWAGGTDPAALRAMAGLGAIGVKIYMATAPGFDELYSPDVDAVARVLAVSESIGWASAIHVGNQSASDAHRDALVAAGRLDLRAVLEVNRGEANILALRDVIHLAVENHYPLHLAHLSAYGDEALDIFASMRGRSTGLTAESCFPGLSEEEDLRDHGPYVMPTVFSADSRARWLEAMEAGVIDAIATDHAPHTRAEKEQGRENGWLAPAGYPAVETSLPLAYDAMLTGQLSAQRMIGLMATGPASILGLGRKGRIATGYDADLVLADPTAEWTVDENALHSTVGWSPFHGRRLRGRLVDTYLGGRQVAHRGEILAPGLGRFVSRIDAEAPGFGNSASDARRD